MIHTKDPIKQKSGRLIILLWSGGGVKEEDKIINLPHKEKIRVIEYYYYSDITYITKLRHTTNKVIVMTALLRLKHAVHLLILLYLSIPYPLQSNSKLYNH